MKREVIMAVDDSHPHHLTKHFSNQDLVTRMLDCPGLGG